MKNYYLLLIAICFVNITNAQIVNIPDVNFKNKLLMSTYTNTIARDQFGNNIRIDNNNDGQIQNSELVIVSKLNLDYSNIADLTGIQAFTNLNELSCYNNVITSINVSALTYLTQIECSYNQLTSLNISGLKYLQGVLCRNNKLTSLNFNGNTDLNRVECQNNLLTSLNLSGQTNLYWLYCSNNQISNLSFDGAPLNYLYCDNNKISSLNLSTVKNLLSLNCGNNLLTTLNVSGFTRIEDIYCSQNHLSSLDISGLGTLSTLDCSFNQLKGPNAFKFSGTNKLYRLNCSNNQLESFVLTNSIIGFLDLSNNPTLTTVDLSGCSALKGSSAPNGTATDFDLSNGQLTTLNLTDCSSLKVIKCNNNLLTNITLLNMQSLKQLDCSNNQLTNLSISGMVNQACGGYTCGGLTNLNCSNNQLKNLTISGVTGVTYKVNDPININCTQNQFTTLDFSSVKSIGTLDLGINPNLISLNLKNGSNENAVLFANTPLLQNICEDANQVSEIQSAIAHYGYTNCSVSSNCEFLSTPDYTVFSELKIYPNPTKHYLNIDISAEVTITSIGVYNTLGQLVMVVSAAQKVRTVDVSTLTMGTYFMKINSDKATVTKKFIKY